MSRLSFLVFRFPTHAEAIAGWKQARKGNWLCSGSVSADESVPPSTTTTIVVEQYDEESGLIRSQIDEHTIEVSLPD